SRPMASWAHFASALQDRTVIAFDAPGVGASQTPVVPHSMPMFADTAARVLDAFGIAKADVVGFSFGGAVAQQIAFGHPSRVNRLVLLATSCGVGSVPGRAHDVTRILLRPNDGTRWAPPDPLGLLWQIAAISTWSSIGDLPRIEAPTLIVCGAGDKAVPPANSRTLAARIPDARLVTIRAGHDLQKPGPAAVVAPTGRAVSRRADPDGELIRPSDSAEGQRRIVAGLRRHRLENRLFAGRRGLIVGRDDGRIDSHNGVACNRAGAETRCENPGGL